MRENVGCKGQWCGEKGRVVVKIGRKGGVSRVRENEEGRG